ncbi:MAG TPA: HAD family hydrolase [Solirubrobacteraceae bacterium]|nr:HAD family hydrolase [Solirubrobacteraceae bacterium]
MPEPHRPLRAAFFDLGETLVSERRSWEAWADWLGVPRARLFAVMRTVIEQGDHHRRIFEILRPGLDPAAEEAKRASAGVPTHEQLYDFYPDALSCLASLRAAGLRVGVAGNQHATVEAWLRQRLEPDDLIASSGAWGVEKPSPEFFARLIELADEAPEAIAYVGDRVDNDVLPAADAGLVTVFVRRGPWGEVHARWPGVERADIRVDDLTAAADALLAWGSHSDAA